jgi:hypothetical protein
MRLGVAASLLANPILGSVASAIRALPGDAPADCDLLNALAAARGIRTASGASLRFVPPRAPSREFDEQYEVRAYRYGEIATRPDNWHDFFNALVWLTFPRTKATLNAHHFRELSTRVGAPLRGTARDVLTLFDEGGLIVASADEALARLIARFEWKELFWTRRAEVARHMRFCVFGHAILEKALSPYPGVTAKALIIPIERALLAADRDALIAALDARTAAYFQQPAALVSTRALGPLPILGIPGWAAANDDPVYYDDTRQFRPRPARRDG